MLRTLPFSYTYTRCIIVGNVLTTFIFDFNIWNDFWLWAHLYARNTATVLIHYKCNSISQGMWWVNDRIRYVSSNYVTNVRLCVTVALFGFWITYIIQTHVSSEASFIKTTGSTLYIRPLYVMILQTYFEFRLYVVIVNPFSSAC